MGFKSLYRRAISCASALCTAGLVASALDTTSIAAERTDGCWCG